MRVCMDSGSLCGRHKHCWNEGDRESPCTLGIAAASGRTCLCSAGPWESVAREGARTHRRGFPSGIAAKRRHPRGGRVDSCRSVSCQNVFMLSHTFCKRESGMPCGFGVSLKVTEGSPRDCPCRAREGLRDAGHSAPRLDKGPRQGPPTPTTRQQFPGQS